MPTDRDVPSDALDVTEDEMSEMSPAEGATVPVRRRWTVERVAVCALLAVVAVLANALHRHGHSWGDDFTLYVNQARSLYEGETRSVIETNRFNVLNAATPTFSPYGYPWVWPIVLSPFVAVFGLDYDHLKWAEVILFVGGLALLHRLVRRRMDAIAAWLLVAVLGFSPYLLAHTDKLLSEYPYLVAVLLALCWLDRLTREAGAWRVAATRELVVLGLLAAVAFNVRREGLALLPAIAAAQLVGRAPWRRLWIPHGTFAVAVVSFQLLLPTAFLPRYPDDGFHLAGDMLRGPFPRGIAEHLSLGVDGYGLTVALLLVALLGGLLRMVRHARTDVALFVFPLAALVAFARFPFNGDPRYYIQVLPFALYFLAQLPSTVAELIRPDDSTQSPDRQAERRAVPAALGAAVLGALALVQVWHLPAPVREARTFDRTGQVQFGPVDPAVRAVLDAVDENTPPDAIVAFMRARTMTLYTGRRSVQSSDLFVVLRRADYLAMMRDSDFSQPLVTDADAEQYGLTSVWEDSRWILWKIEPPDSIP